MKKTSEKQNAAAKDSDINMSLSEIENAVDALAAEPKKQRIWEIDAIRGLMILFVVFDHFMFDVRYLKGSGYESQLFQWLLEFSQTYVGGALRKLTQPVFVLMFVFTSGVSCSFSHSNGKRAIKMVLFAILFTVVTYALSQILNNSLAIYFNVIHVIALSVLLWALIEFLHGFCKKNWQKNIFGFFMTAIIVTVLIVGEIKLKSPSTSNNSIWFFLYQHTGGDFTKFAQGDYLPFFPAFGWFLIGAFLGKLLYKDKKSVFPSVNAKYVAPLTFCGRYSIWMYFGSQIVMYGLLYLLKNILGWI